MKTISYVIFFLLISIQIYSQKSAAVDTYLNDSISNRTTVTELPKNLICTEYALGFWIDTYYERLFPAGDHIGFTLRTGPSIGAGFVGGVALHGGAGIVVGKKRSYAYLSGGIRHEFEEELYRDTPYTQPYIELFYRFIGYNGFVFQVGVEAILLSAGIGYVF